MVGDFPPNSVEIAQRIATQFGRAGATRIVAAPALGNVVPVGVVPGVGLPVTPGLAGPVTIKFRRPGTVVALYGQELRGTAAAFARTAVRVLIGGQEDLFTDGTSGVYVPFLALFGQTSNWFPLNRRAKPGVDWSIFFANSDTGSTAQPFFSLAFIEDQQAPSPTAR